MIKKKILFITGAGSSFDFGFPTGQSLITKIMNENWNRFGDNKLGLEISEGDFRSFRDKLKFSNTPSIDIFIANNPDYVDLSKSLIAKIIGEHESKAITKLFESSWLKYIWNKMIEGCVNIDDFFDGTNAKFLTFNYDRTLELFFILSIANFFNIKMDSQQYQIILEKIPIVHVFGKVGNLPWEDGNKTRPFENNTPGAYLTWRKVGQELKTIYETKESEKHSEIIEMINDSDEVYFLGFGYNTFNLELLDIKNWSESKYISGSRYGMSDSEIKDVNYLNNNKFNDLSRLSTFDSYDFLKNEVQFFSKDRKSVV